MEKRKKVINFDFILQGIALLLLIIGFFTFLFRSLYSPDNQFLLIVSFITLFIGIIIIFFKFVTSKGFKNAEDMSGGTGI
jgi:hypothetical protein